MDLGQGHQSWLQIRIHEQSGDTPQWVPEIGASCWERLSVTALCPPQKMIKDPPREPAGGPTRADPRILITPGPAVPVEVLRPRSCSTPPVRGKATWDEIVP